MIGTSDPAGDASAAQGNAQLAPKQHQQTIKSSMANNIHNQNQQNSNPQTHPANNVVPPQTQSAPQQQQQLAQQQQIGPLANQQMTQSLLQQPSEHLPQNFPQPHQISPPQNATYPANAIQSQHQQAQVLQHIPPQPLFQQHAGQQNVMISPHQQQLGQQHVVMHQQIMHPPQLQQPYHQQLQQQPMAMLQTPILCSNAPSTNNSPQKATKKAVPTDTQSVASLNDAQAGSEKAPVPVSTVKKGRFVVKKSAVPSIVKNNEPRAATSTAVPTDNLSIASSNDAQAGSEKAPVTVKKGRFVVKKAAVPSTGKKSSTQNSDLCTADEKTANAKEPLDAGRAVAVEQVEAAPKKKGRFLVKTGGSAASLSAVESKPLPAADAGVEAAKRNASGLENGIYKIDKGKGETSDVLEQSEVKANVPRRDSKGDIEAVPPVTVSTKKKGRFLVKKTGGIAAGTQTGINATISSSDGVQNTGPQISNCADETDRPKGNASDVALDQSTDISAALPTVVSTKKKGRFVVKTNTGGVVSASTPAAVDAALSPPDGVQNTGIGNAPFINAPIVQLTPTTTMPNYIAGNVPIPIAGMPATSLVDMNGQMMVVSNVALPLSQPAQQHHLQHVPASQPQHIVNPPVLSAQTSVGTTHQHPHPPQQQPPHHSDAPSQLAPAPRSRAGTDERAHESVSKAHVPRANRPAGSSGSSWASGTRAPPGGGKNGRLIGGGGVGKVLHHLDTLRTEVIEADRCIASLQSDNRFLRDKNKELEAKNKDLERRLHAAEAKCRSLSEKVRDQRTDGANQPQRETSGELEINSIPSTDGRLENHGSASFEEMQTAANVADNQRLQGQRLAAIQSTGQTQSKAPVNKAVSSTAVPDSNLISRRSSVGISPAGSQSMTELSSIAKQFDPLGAAPPSIEANGVPVTQTCISAMTSIPLIVTTSIGQEHRNPPPMPPPPPPTFDETPKTSANILKVKHFDPLGTPEGSREATVPSAIVLSSVPQMPQMPAMATHIDGGNGVAVIVPLVPQQHQQQQKPQQEDPFDEIVRMSHSHGTI